MTEIKDLSAAVYKFDQYSGIVDYLISYSLSEDIGTDLDVLHGCLRFIYAVENEEIQRKMNIPAATIAKKLCMYYVDLIKASDEIEDLRRVQELIKLCFFYVDKENSSVIGTVLDFLWSSTQKFLCESTSSDQLYRLYDVIKTVLESIPQKLNYVIELPWLQTLINDVDKVLNYSLDAFMLFVSNVFPVIMKLVDHDQLTDFLSFVWMKVSDLIDKYSAERYQESEIFPYIFSYFFAVIEKICELKIDEFLLEKTVSNICFWGMLQNGLRNSYPHIRTKAIHVFREVADYISCKELTDFTSENPLYILSQVDMSAWNDIALLLEMLEENQTHLVKPVLGRLELMLYELHKSACELENNKILDMWILIILQRVLQHESKYVKTYGITQLVNSWSKCTTHLLLDEKISEKFLDVMLQCLNVPSLFLRDERAKTSISPDQLSSCLFDYWNVLPAGSKARNFLKKLFSHMVDFRWTIALSLYMSKAMANFSPKNVLQKEDIVAIREFVKYTRSFHCEGLSSATEVYILKVSLHQLCWENVNFEDLAELLSLFDSDSILSLESEVIGILKKYIHNNPEREHLLKQSINYCFHHYTLLSEMSNDLRNIDSFPGLQKHSRLLRLLFQADVICSDDCDQFLGNDQNHLCILKWSDILEEVYIAFYSFSNSEEIHSQFGFLHCVQFFLFLIKEFSTRSHMEKVKSTYVEFLSKVNNDVLYSVMNYLLRDINSIDDICRLQLCIKILDQFTANEDIRSTVIVPNAREIFLLCYEKLHSVTFIDEVNLLHVQLCFRWLFNNAIIYDSVNTIDVLEVIFFDISKLPVLQFNIPNFVLENFYEDEWCKVIDVLVEGWWFITQCLHVINNYENSTLLDIETAVSGMQSCHFSCLPAIILHLRHLFTKLVHVLDGPKFFSIVKDIYDSVMHYRQRNIFQKFIQSFIEMAFDNPLMIKFHQELLKISFMLMKFGEKQPHILCKFLAHLLSIFREENNRHLITLYSSFLAQCLIHGPMLDKEQKLKDNALSFLFDADDYIRRALSQLLFSSRHIHPRVMMLQFVLTTDFFMGHISSSNINILIQDLLIIEKGACKSKLSTLGDGSLQPLRSNSFEHRVQNRVWQMILLLHSDLSDESKIELIEKVFDLLSVENLQPSVRYNMEWLSTKIICSSPSTYHVFQRHIQNQIEAARPNFSISLLTIMIFLIKCKYLTFEGMVLEWMPIILSCCTSHKFSVRIHASLAMKRIWQLCATQNFEFALNKFDHVELLIRSFEDSHTG